MTDGAIANVHGNPSQSDSWTNVSADGAIGNIKRPACRGGILLDQDSAQTVSVDCAVGDGRGGYACSAIGRQSIVVVSAQGAAGNPEVSINLKDSPTLGVNDGARVAIKVALSDVRYG